MKYLCMTNDEYAGWLAAAVALSSRVTSLRQPKSPCSDCPAFFEAAMRAEDRCIRAPRASDHRRAQWREAKRRQRVAA